MQSPLAKQLMDLWRSGASVPDVFAFLNEQAAPSLSDAVAVIVADQQSRWRTDRPLRVEDYLAKLPDLKFDRAARVAMAIGEFQARLASGTAPDIDEFTRRFSDLADSLPSQLTALTADESPPSGGEPIAATQSFPAARDGDGAGTTVPGERIGRYRVIRLLGVGTFGQVWLGADDELQRQVAIKVPAPQRFRASEDSQAYLAEARTLATLDHPHIVPVYDVGRTAEGAIYVVSKFVPGLNLAERIRKRPFSHFESAQIAATVAEALEHAHNAGLIHRDIKPANLLIEEPTQRPYVADFGLAIRQQHHGGEDPIAGTPVYMSPEQVRGESPLDGRSDIFSLGVVLYELLVGRRPFGGATTGQLFAEIASCEPAPLCTIDGTVPAELERICHKALAKRASDRYQRAGDFAADLRAWQRQSQADAKPVPHNMPAPISPLVGRERDVTAVKRLLAESRLVTLTGPGGIGKTRLGIEIARELLSDFPGGVFLVELAAIRASELVASAIAQVVDCREQPGKSTVECLCERFAGAGVLLVLDNFEHVLEAAGVVSDLLAACPALKVLMTSRAPVHIVGEQEYPVPLLACPDPARPPPWEEAAAYSAVALFAQRAREASPDFQLNQENASAVAEICARLDGLPLAIELAASWIKVLPLAALRERLQKRLSLPAGRRSIAPQRQQTLRSAIAWSYDLLDPAEQRLFLRLAVFEGGCTLDAAEVVVPLGSQRVDVLDGMASLVDKSLLRQIERASGTARYSMLETVREFALEGLAASGEEEASRCAHAEYFVALAEDLEPHLSGPDAGTCLGRLAQEHANVRAVLEWSIAPERGNGAEDHRRELGLRIGGAMWRYWCSRGHLHEGKTLLGDLLKVVATGRQDNVTAKARYAAGCVAEDLGEFAAALSLYEQARCQWESDGNVKQVASALIALGSVHSSQGDYSAAGNFHRQALALSRQVDDRHGIAVALSNLGSVAWAIGDYDSARSFHEEGLAIRRVLRNQNGIAVSLTSLGLIAARQRDDATARGLYKESLQILKSLQNRSGIAVCLNNLAEIACRTGELAEALQLGLEAAQIQQELGDRLSLAYTLESLAEIAGARGQPERLVKLAAAADQLRVALGAPVPPAERAGLERQLAAARETLGSGCYGAAWQAGANLSQEAAIACAQGASTA